MHGIAAPGSPSDDLQVIPGGEDCLMTVRKVMKGWTIDD